MDLPLIPSITLSRKFSIRFFTKCKMKAKSMIPSNTPQLYSTTLEISLDHLKKKMLMNFLDILFSNLARNWNKKWGEHKNNCLFVDPAQNNLNNSSYSILYQSKFLKTVSKRSIAKWLITTLKEIAKNAIIQSRLKQIKLSTFPKS